MRRRKRRDTSDSGSAGCLGSPRKREGGSLPCDVARGSKQQPSDPVLTGQSCTTTTTLESCVINMEGLTEDRSSSSLAEEDRFSEPWKLRMPSRGEHVSSGCVEPMDMEICTADEVTSGPLVSDKSKATESTALSSPNSAANYGTIPTSYPDYGEVDAAIPLFTYGGLDTSASSSARLEQYSRHSPMNGLPTDEGQLLRRVPPRRIGGKYFLLFFLSFFDTNYLLHFLGNDYGSITDENGNPFGNFNGSSISFSPQLLQSRTSPPSSASFSTLNSNSSGLASKLVQRANKAKKRSKEGPAVLSDDMPGFRGDKDVEELLEYIESSGGKTSGDSKVNKAGGNGAKQNGAVPSLASSATKSASASNKSSSKTNSNKLLMRQVHSNEADSEDSDDSAPGRQENVSYPMGNSKFPSLSISFPLYFITFGPFDYFF